MQQNLEKIGMSEWQKRDKAVIWHPFTPLVGREDPVMIKAANGVYLHTEDGRHIIDAISSWWVNLHGHSNPQIADALARQARELEHAIFAGFTHQPAICLAEKLLSILPPNQAKIFYSDNGSTAVEVALKMAIQYWHNKGVARKKILAIEGAYHGDTFGAMSVGERGAFIDPFRPFLFDVSYIPFPAAGDEEATLSALEACLETEDFAAFIFEPLVQGAAGMRMYSPAVLDKMMGMAKEKHVLCIADEVMTGFGRTGKIFATDHTTHHPDIFCLSKGLTGGTMALGVTSCTQSVQQAFHDADVMKTFFHGHSFTANPLACAVALASFELLMDPKCLESRNRIAACHAAFRDKHQHSEQVKEIRSFGTILAIELATTEATSYFNAARNNLYAFFLQRNILLRPLGNIIYILPPYIITNEELAKIYQAIEDLFTERASIA